MQAVWFVILSPSPTAKSFQDRLPKTEYALTARGRRSLGRYLDHMEALIRATRGK